MKKILYTFAIAAAIASCTGKTADPVAQSLKNAIRENSSAKSTIRLYTIECTDSTSFRTEFDRRAKMFEEKSRREGELYARYITEGKPRNADIHMRAMTKANRNLEALDSLRSAMEAVLDNTAYYDYRFSGKLSSKDGVTEYRDCWFTITPDGKIMTITQDAKNLHKNSGRAIPGYMDIFGGQAMEEE